MRLNEYLKKITAADERAMAESQKKWDSIAKPLRSLGRLEEMVIKLAGIEKSCDVPPRKKAVLIFCADNGIVEEKVTQSESNVTAIVAENFTRGIATVNSLAYECGADVFPIDIGIAKDMDCGGIINRKIAYGTKNFAREPAMTREQAENAIIAGIELVKQKKDEGYNLIITGEMGIGNTSTSSAVLSALESVPPEMITGRGAGLTSEGVKHKAEVIKNAVKLHSPNKDDVIDVLSKVGGFDICGMAGAFIGGAVYHIPVIIDGLISSVAALCAVRLEPLCRDYIFASHCSAEPAGRIALDAVGLKAYLECGMCLGEGTGGVIGAKLFDFALAAYNETAYFSQANVEQYKLLK
ncbi:MAG: nicotinate-nucleotide--dimethylbenzimidazole phosphoribosyltransferase [Oscillospiraceae bacterium]|nr:nicotinate-nucleotide--dimethylbenzimidazole phosphoribosyltransferase [Oscillospiraceae bacterium]